MTLFSLSSLDPDSWSAAVRRKRSVFVAAGRIIGASNGSGMSAGACWNGGSSFVVEVAVVLLVGKEDEDDMRDGATVEGGVKNERSSSVSKKSLQGAFNATEHE
jgi:hypothetical protein